MKVLLGLLGMVLLIGLGFASVIDDQAQSSPPPIAGLAPMPASFRALYIAAARTCPGLAPEVLMGIGEIESGHGANNGPSYAGAIGPMQFEPATWAIYGVDGDGDGNKDPWNPADAIYGSANMLCHDGAGNPRTLAAAVELYNPGDPSYSANVLRVAAIYAAQDLIPTPGGAPSGTVAP